MEIQFNKNVRLGEGGYGSVFPGMFQNRDVAVKRVDLLHATDNEEALKQLRHPNVVKLFHVECTDDFKYFALELCDASLDQIFLETDDPRKYKGPELPDHLNIFSQLALGLEYIHSKNLIHRDIKPGNVLISVDSTAGQEVKVTMKLADFGLSRPVNERGTFTMHSGVKGSKMWYAPELFRLLQHFKPPNMMEQPRGTVKSDVFALGLVIAFLILDGQHLYGSTEIDIVKNIIEENMINMNSNYTIHIAYDLIQKMLKSKPEDRISSSDVVEQLKSIQVKPEEKELEEAELVATSSFPETNPIEKSPNPIQPEVINVTNRKDGSVKNALHLLCANNSSDKLIDAIKLLIQSGFDVNEKNSDGWNALHFLCANNSHEKLMDAINFLIQLGIDVNGKDNSGSNALHLMCRYNSSERIIDAIQLLIQLGINVNGANNDGWNALHFLCRYNSSDKLIDAIKLLMELGIDVMATNKYGSNSLHFLSSNEASVRLMDAIKLLVQLGIGVNWKANDGKNALHFLCRYNSSRRIIDAIKLLIDLRIDVNGKDNDGRNALHLLVVQDSCENLVNAIRLLIQLGMEINERDGKGWNALHILCATNSSERLIDAMKHLIQLGIDVNEKDRQGWNALHFLCHYNSSRRLNDAIKLLIQFGIDANWKNDDGWNALHYLCMNNSSESFVEAINTLIQSGSN